MEHEPENERPLLHSTRLPPAPTSEMRPSDDQATRAQELRDALEELKADLDGHARGRSASASASGAGATTSPPPSSAPSSAPSTTPSTAPSSAPSSASSSAAPTSDEHRARAVARSGRRLALGTLAAVVVLAGAIGVVRVVAWSVAGARDIPTRPSGSAWSAPTPSPSVPAASPSATTAGTPTPSVSPPQTARPAFVLPAGLPRSGPGADAPGAELTAVLEHGDSVVVYERLVVRPGTTSVHLGAAPVQALPRNLQGVGFTVTDLRVSVDGRAVTAPGDSLRGWRVTGPDGAAFTRLVLRYRLAGAVVRANPAPPGRGTLVLRPITAAQASLAHDPVVVRLQDRRVGQVYCPSGPQPLCDTVRGTAHVATVPAGAPPIVLAQVTVP